jgi:5-methylcytosine-specific restriction enzyme subunit McrC
LSERRPHECRLRRADVDVLIGEHRGRFEVVPAGRPGRYRVTSLGHVGVLALPSRTLVIRPKIPLRNLGFLLDPDLPAPSGVAGEPSDDLFGWLAGAFARLLQSRVEAGLHRDYAERDERLATPRGRIDLVARLREPPGRTDAFPCRHDAFTPDVPCNRLARAATEAALRTPLVSATTRAELESALATFADVDSTGVRAEDFDVLPIDRRTEAYRPLLELARWLMAGLGGGPSRGGSARCPAFLLDLGRVFERYVTRGVESAVAEGRLTAGVQRTWTVADSSDGSPGPTVRPDVTLDRDGQPRLVIDAKWKRLRGLPEPDDLHQAIAYGATLGVRRVMLVYPGRRDVSVRYTTAGGGLVVEARTLRVAARLDACRRSLARFGRECLRLAGRGD